jgi:hypothetical protein
MRIRTRYYLIAVVVASLLLLTFVVTTRIRLVVAELAFTKEDLDLVCFNREMALRDLERARSIGWRADYLMPGAYDEAVTEKQKCDEKIALLQEKKAKLELLLREPWRLLFSNGFSVPGRDGTRISASPEGVMR